MQIIRIVHNIKKNRIMKTKVLTYGSYPRHDQIVTSYLALDPYGIEGIYTHLREKDERDERNDYLDIYFHIAGIYFLFGEGTRSYIAQDYAKNRIEKTYPIWTEWVLEKADNNAYITLMEIEVFKQLGLDCSKLEESRRNAGLAREEEQQRRNEVRKERARKQAVKQHLEETARLANVRSDFLAGKMIASEDFLDIMKKDGYKVHIRTIGTIRKRITSVRMNGDYYYRPLQGKRKPCTTGLGDVLFGYAAFLKTQMSQDESCT